VSLLLVAGFVGAVVVGSVRSSWVFHALLAVVVLDVAGLVLSPAL
jgi:hypothetical protein